ncbi:MAG: aminoacyl-tRNA hydrolase [Nitrospira sp.]|nr:aminoacyl-tRNA hydrolase [bacterium]MBL7048949.1 aminoacyl-tRNA hydrolase [Nitrospira sp.]
MWLLVGLGNPGEEYAATRHNAGFMVIDAVAARHSISFRQKKTNYEYATGRICGDEALLVKPLTYMNRSGHVVREIINKHDEIHEIIVIHDDLDIEPGTIKIKTSGSAGGHNGVSSIIECLGSGEFTRIKIGIGRPARMPAVKYVLQNFSSHEKNIMDDTVENAVDAVEYIVNKGTSSAQCFFNKKPQS